MATVELSELTKIFAEGANEIVAVDSLDLSIADGEFLVLVGPSGCGKSTTLRCVAGLEEVTSGDILIDDEVITDKNPKDRDIAMVFQNYALYPHMSVRKNMSFGLKMSTNMDGDEIKSRVEEAAAMMGIEPLLNKKPKSLSGGQQQRVALGRAIVRDPAVFLMDEPLSNLDAKLRSQMRTELQNLQQNLGVTTIYVTHDQTEAMTMGDRIAILDGGQLQQVDTPLNCYHQPANQFVAGFIGEPSMNFTDVVLEERTDGSSVLVAEGFDYPISSSTAQTLQSAESAPELVLGIRPEDITLASNETEARIVATAQVTEPLGDAMYVYLNIAGQQYTANFAGNLGIESGDEVQIDFPEEYLHMFDTETGDAVLNRRAPVESQSDAIISPGTGEGGSDSSAPSES